MIDKQTKIAMVEGINFHRFRVASVTEFLLLGKGKFTQPTYLSDVDRDRVKVCIKLKSKAYHISSYQLQKLLMKGV